MLAAYTLQIEQLHRMSPSNLLQFAKASLRLKSPWLHYGCALGQHQNDLSTERSVTGAAHCEGKVMKAATCEVRPQLSVYADCWIVMGDAVWLQERVQPANRTSLSSAKGRH